MWVQNWKRRNKKATTMAPIRMWWKNLELESAGQGGGHGSADSAGPDMSVPGVAHSMPWRSERLFHKVAPT